MVWEHLNPKRADIDDLPGDKSGHRYVLLLAPLWGCFLFFSTAFAQTTTCPGLDNDAAAAEQAVCWFNNDKAGLPECASNQGTASLCIAQSNAWCADASLDDDIVTTACLMAAIGVGQLREAKDVAKYLRSPSQTAANCASALKRASIRVLTNPAGAEVMIDDRSYGKAPIEVTLIGPWWESRIKAKFTSGADFTEVDVSPSELLNAFDKRECIFGDLIVTAPDQSGPVFPIDATFSLPTAASPQPQPAIKSAVRVGAPPITKPAPRALISQTPRSRSNALLWTSIALGALGVASSATAIGLYVSGKADIKYLEKRCAPNGCLEGTFNDGLIKSKYRWGNVLLIAGGISLIGATVLYFLNGSSAPEGDTAFLSIVPTGFKLHRKF